VQQVIRISGHYYAVPVDIHMPAWIWYSKQALARAGVTREPQSFDELLAALDQLRAAGIIPLAHGGQPWQENILFTAVLANVGGRAMYLGLLRDRDPAVIQSAGLRHVLRTFKRLHDYIDEGAPGRNWNDATALLITGKAGVQIMGDWAKGELSAAGLEAGRDYGCIAGFGPQSPYIVQGDVFVFPKTTDPAQIKAQQLMARVVMSPNTQVEFSRLKGSIPARRDVDAARLDVCARLGLRLMADPAREVGNGEMYLTPDQNGALADVLTDFWNNDVSAEEAQRRILAALRG
jgi:glucose/mannose transport system substrate-binding protein